MRPDLLQNELSDLVALAFYPHAEIPVSPAAPRDPAPNARRIASFLTGYKKPIVAQEQAAPVETEAAHSTTRDIAADADRHAIGKLRQND